jgi:hypothetical protein
VTRILVHVDGARTLVYYGGYRSGHKVNPLSERLLGVATMMRDRYAGHTGAGTVTTRPVRLGGRLTVNARGGVLVRVGALSCRSAGDGVALRVRCPRPLPHSPVRLSFTLRGGTVWSFSTG